MSAPVSNGVQAHDVVLLVVAATEERVGWLGVLLSALLEMWPGDGPRNTVLEVRRAGQLLARREFSKKRMALRARQALADRLRVLSDDEAHAIDDWEILLEAAAVAAS